jgi:hypothetical protein
LEQKFLDAKNKLAEKLVFSAYPQIYVANNNTEKNNILVSIKNGCLLRDILILDNQKDPVFILNLLRLIAFQIGNDISYD